LFATREISAMRSTWVATPRSSISRSVRESSGTMSTPRICGGQGGREVVAVGCRRAGRPGEQMMLARKLGCPHLANVCPVPVLERFARERLDDRHDLTERADAVAQGGCDGERRREALVLKDLL
jgi:hypothetical protein